MHVSRARRSTAIAALGLAVTVLLSACGAGDGDDSSGGTADAAGLDRAKAQLATYRDVVDGYVPSERLSDPTALKGKKVMYIPAVAAIPFFVTSWNVLQEALAAAGVESVICDAHADPAKTSACLDQARNDGVDGIILDALSPSIAQQSYDAVVGAGIPVVLGNLPRPDGSPDTVQALDAGTTLAVRLAADSIIVAAEGTGSVVGVRNTDSPVTQSWYDEGIAEFDTNASAMKVVTVDSKTAEQANLPAKVSAAILANPDARYSLGSVPQSFAEAAAQGAQDAGRPEVLSTTAAATLGDLQRLKSGTGYVSAVGWDIARISYYEADVMFRLILGDPVDTSAYVTPVRVFDRDNVDELDITEDGWVSSDWFGGDAYQAEFTSLWQGDLS